MKPELSHLLCPSLHLARALNDIAQSTILDVDAAA